ncbi:MAG TPA: hypothetical protein VEI02_08360, partial [Planctomycetota bacterium]|nr:hypothetical protein [Planctomycetota bacterium]
VGSDALLPRAFAAYLARCTAEAGDAVAAAALRLEAAMLEARRAPRRGAVAPGPGEVALAPEARLVRLPRGTTATVAAVRERLEAGEGLDRAAVLLGPGDETALIVAGPRRGPRLAPVRVEALEPPVDALLAALETPLAAAARAAFAERHDADVDALEAFLDALERDGAVLRGR